MLLAPCAVPKPEMTTPSGPWSTVTTVLMGAATLNTHRVSESSFPQNWDWRHAPGRPFILLESGPPIVASGDVWALGGCGESIAPTVLQIGGFMRRQELNDIGP